MRVNSTMTINFVAQNATRKLLAMEKDVSKSVRKENFLARMEKLVEIAATVALSMHKELDASRVVLVNSLPLTEKDALKNALMVTTSMHNSPANSKLAMKNVVAMLEPIIRIVCRTVEVHFTSLMKIMFKSVYRLVVNSFLIEELLLINV